MSCKSTFNGLPPPSPQNMKFLSIILKLPKCGICFSLSRPPFACDEIIPTNSHQKGLSLVVNGHLHQHHIQHPYNIQNSHTWGETEGTRSTPHKNNTNSQTAPHEHNRLCDLPAPQKVCTSIDQAFAMGGVDMGQCFAICIYLYIYMLEDIMNRVC